VAEYIKNLDNIFYNVELAGAAINTCKLDWCKHQIDIVRYMCGIFGRAPADKKIIKIRE